jgi:hypothetical protein
MTAKKAVWSWWLITAGAVLMQLLANLVAALDLPRPVYWVSLFSAGLFSWLDYYWELSLGFGPLVRPGKNLWAGRLNPPLWDSFSHGCSLCWPAS